ncbi:MAG: MFS transporter, partial [Planctomycetes bacterium]|nr:MFS transporter [Planctomycetota bacterium]
MNKEPDGVNDHENDGLKKSGPSDNKTDGPTHLSYAIRAHLNPKKTSGKPALDHPNKVESANIKKNITAGIIGNVLEWYDFAVFGYFAPIIGTQFFPSDNPVTSLLSAFGVFAAGYFARPLGGMIFGRMGDKFGRKTALQASVMLMAIPTFLISILPTYAQIGLMAPILLITLRLLQGL